MTTVVVSVSQIGIERRITMSMTFKIDDRRKANVEKWEEEYRQRLI